MQRLLRNAPPSGQGVASCSGRAAPLRAVACRTLKASRPGHGPRSSRPHQLPPCRITSTSSELYASKEAKDMNMDDDGEDNYMDLPDYQVFDPDKGPLEKRVQRSFLDAVADDKMDLRDTEYWFSTPEEGWNATPKRVYFMTADEEPLFPMPWHNPEEEEDALERIGVDQLEEGRVYLGRVTDVWLHHGAQVDIGAEFDGLVPCNEDHWELAVDHIDIGEVVMVEVHKLRTPGLYRWPVQLKFTVRGLQDLMMPPDDYVAPVDHGWAEANGWTPEDVAEAAGRTLEVPTYYPPQDDNAIAEQVLEGYGTGRMPWRLRDSEPVEDYIDDPLDNPIQEAWDARGDELEAAASELASSL